MRTLSHSRASASAPSASIDRDDGDRSDAGNASRFGTLASPRPRSVAIVGGGLSGTVVALTILETCPDVARVHLIERTVGNEGRGLAYARRFVHQPLNVVAARMSLRLDRPDDFVRWLRLHFGRRFSPDDFVSRKLFGDYATDALAECSDGPGRGRLSVVHDEALAILPGHDARYRIELRSGATLDADWVVLALGNSPPSDLDIPNRAFLASPFYASNPWDDSATADLEPNDPVAFVGAGLTMIDLAIALELRGHRGVIHAISRHGLLPQVHRATPPRAMAAPSGTRELRALELYRWVRREVDAARLEGGSWRSVIDGLRELTPELWSRMPVVERRRFVRHMRPYWEVHRHRMPPESASLIADLRFSGRLRLIAGRVLDVEVESGLARVDFRRRGRSTVECVQVRKVVNCTGPECGSRRLDGPLMAQLLGKGWLAPDELLLGIRTDPDGTVINANGARIPGLVAIGALRKGTLWESTALAEIRKQAEALVLQIAEA